MLNRLFHKRDGSGFLPLPMRRDFWHASQLEIAKPDIKHPRDSGPGIIHQHNEESVAPALGSMRVRLSRKGGDRFHAHVVNDVRITWFFIGYFLQSIESVHQRHIPVSCIIHKCPYCRKPAV